MVQLISITVLFCLWLTYAYFEGKREAFFWFSFNNLETKYKVSIVKLINDFHSLFTWQRSVTALILSLGFVAAQGFSFLSSPYHLINLALFVFSLILSFSFIHNGTYYCTRNDITPDVYKQRFKDYSLSSKAKFEFTYTERFNMFILSLIFLIISIFKTWSS